MQRRATFCRGRVRILPAIGLSPINRLRWYRNKRPHSAVSEARLNGRFKVMNLANPMLLMGQKRSFANVRFWLAFLTFRAAYRLAALGSVPDLGKSDLLHVIG